MTGAYITDFNHYLDDDGELVTEMPAAMRKLASFTALIIDYATATKTPATFTSKLRCRKRGCHGAIVIGLDDPTDAIHWQCNQCDHDGVISNWQGTKWDNRERVH